MIITKDTSVAEEHKRGGTILITASLLILAAGIIFVITSHSIYTAVVPAIACIVGLIGFHQLDLAARPKEVTPFIFEREKLGAILRSGTGFEVTFAIKLTPSPAPPQALDRIIPTLQSALNRYAMETDQLPSKPFPAFEHLFENAAAPICEEMGVESIAIHTIDVRTETDHLPPTGSVYFRD